MIVVIILHVLICISLILIILLQPSKGTSIGTTFTGGSQAIFGSVGINTFLTKITTLMAFLFLITSLGLAIFANQLVSDTVMGNISSVSKKVVSSKKSINNEK